jgi:cell division septum initiation protein DivIVA
MKNLHQLLDDVHTKIIRFQDELDKLRAVKEYLEQEIAKDNNQKRESANSDGHEEPPPSTQREVAERILRHFNRAAKVDEILKEALKRRWLTLTSSERNMSNSLYGAMARNTDIFIKTGRGEFDLAERQK